MPPNTGHDFGFGSSALDIVQGRDLAGMRVVVTGGASGIGLATATALASAGAEVLIASRNIRSATDIIDSTNDTYAYRVPLTTAELDLADLDSVAAFCRAWSGPLDVLINNAGVMAVPSLTVTRTGVEHQFATNHLGHFALATGLHRALAAAGRARVVNVSSSGHLLSPVVFDDLHFRFRTYDAFGAYGQSKTANVLFSLEAQRRWAGDGIISNALHPGGIATRLQRHVGGGEYMKSADERFRRAGTSLKSVGQGAATSVFLATFPGIDGGRYFEDCAPAQVVDRRSEGTTGGVAPYALDPENAARLWEVSEALIHQA